MSHAQRMLSLDYQSKYRLYGDDWNDAVQVQLHDMKERLLDDAQMHLYVRDHFVKWGIRVNILLIIFSSTTGVVLGVQAAKSDGYLDPLILTALITSAVTAALSSVVSFFNFAERSANHNSASNDCNALADYINQYLYLPAEKRPDCQVVFENARIKAASIAVRANYVGLCFVRKYYNDHKDRKERQPIDISHSFFPPEPSATGSTE